MTAPNVATIGIDLALGHSREVIRDLNETTTAGTKTEQSLKALKTSTESLTVAQRALAAAGNSEAQMLAIVNGEAQKLTTTTQQASRAAEGMAASFRRMREAAGQGAANAFAEQIKQLDPFQKGLGSAAVQLGNVANASRTAGVGINALRGPLTSLTAQMLSLNPTAASTASVLGSFGIGAGPMIAILAGVAALGFAWNRLTKDAREAKEEHQKLLGAVLALRDAEKNGLENSVEAARDDLIKLQQQRSGIAAKQAANGVGGVFAGGGGFAGELADLDKKIKDQIAVVKLGESKLSEIARDAETDRLRNAKQAQEKALADLKRFYDEYSRIAKEREDRAFEDAQRRALFAAVEGRGLPGVQSTGSFGGTFVAPAVAAKVVYGDLLAESRALAESIQEQQRAQDAHTKAIRESVEAGLALAQAFGRTGRELADAVRLAQSLLPMVQRVGQITGLSSGGQVALGAGAAGYSSGSVLGGAASGAVIGAQIGGPLGAAAGALVGAGSGLLGPANALKEAAANVRASEAREGDFITLGVSGVRDERHALNVAVQPLFDELNKQRDDDLISAREHHTRYAALQDAYLRKWNDVATRFWSSIGEEFNALSGPQGEFLNAQNAIQRAYIEQRKSAEALGASTEELTRIDDLRDRKIRDIINRAEQGASSSLLGMLGDTGTFGRDNRINAILESVPLASQNGGWFNQFADYIRRQDDASRRIAEESERANFFNQIQTQIAQQTLQTAQENLRVSEASVGSLTQTLDALRRASASLALGGLSPLNARQRYGIAENELESQFRTALAGGASGQKAAQGIGSFIDSFLGTSKERFASGTPYASDYNRAQSMIDALEGIYGVQLTTEEKTLAELKKHTDLLTKSVSTQSSTLVAQLVARANDKPAEAGAIIGMLRGMGYTLGQNFAVDPNGMGNPTGGYYALGYTGPSNLPGQGNTGGNSTIYNPGYQAYLDAHTADGTNATLTYTDWLDAGQPSYALGTRYHRGGVAMVGERGPELVRMPVGASVTNQDQFSAPIVAALRQEIGALRASFAEQTGELRRAINARNN